MRSASPERAVLSMVVLDKTGAASVLSRSPEVVTDGTSAPSGIDSTDVEVGRGGGPPGTGVCDICVIVDGSSLVDDAGVDVIVGVSVLISGGAGLEDVVGAGATEGVGIALNGAGVVTGVVVPSRFWLHALILCAISKNAALKSPGCSALI